MKPILATSLLLLGLLGSCQTTPSAPEAAVPFRYEGRLQRGNPTSSSPGSPGMVYQRGEKTTRSGYPASPAVMNDLIAHSNFDPTHGHMLALTDTAYGRLNFRCPDGDHYRHSGDTTTISTVAPLGSMQEIIVTRQPDGRYTFTYGRKKENAFPGLIRVGG